MHKLACEYAQGLQMHSLDDKHNLLTVGSANPDDDRKGMWELIQMDLFYRLIYNKPAAFSLDLAGWRVNLPWLTLDTFPDKEAAVPTMKFIVSSRLTFVLIAFFQMFDKLETGSVALEAIEPLCQEIEDLMEEWGIVCPTLQSFLSILPYVPADISLGRLDPKFQTRRSLHVDTY